MSRWQNFYKNGLVKEDKFAQLLVSTFGGIVSHASKKNDVYNHIDIIWTVNNHQYSFDIKGLKKCNRSDSNVDDSIHWIELQNVNGKIGWLYGKADYIVFELLNEFLIVRRVDIIKLIDSKVTNKSISSSKDFYTYYQRAGRLDIIIKVPTNDLYKIARKILYKTC